MARMIRVMIALLAALSPALAGGQVTAARAAAPLVASTTPQTPEQALAQDAAVYARRYGVTPEAAGVRLAALQASAAMTDQVRANYRQRLVGISIDHAPALRIVVLLTGDAPVASTDFRTDRIVIPIEFHTGARSSGDDVIRAMLQRGPELVALLPNQRGMGLDPRTGELVILVRSADAGRVDLAAIKARAEALTGVGVRFDLADRPDNLALAGGGRIEGRDPADGKRYACTTGFAVTDGARDGLATAAHCPDAVDYMDPDGGIVALAFAGQWGARTQDVQINVSGVAQRPLFYADRKQGALRTLAGSRSRLSTRGGEWLCHYGESSGYSCAEVELTQFAPPGQLCGGACAPTWITVRTHDCKSGDSGGPVFSGDIAFGITKGGSGGHGTRCNFYFYMSTDFLPAGWRLLSHRTAVATALSGSRAR